MASIKFVLHERKRIQKLIDEQGLIDSQATSPAAENIPKN
jgi:hypothetical protein